MDYSTWLLVSFFRIYRNYKFYVTGSLYLKLGMLEEAKKEYNILLERNPENVDYYKNLQEAENLKSDNEKYELLCRYRMKFPRALMPRRMVLNCVEGEYVMLYFQKTKRSSFSFIVWFYFFEILGRSIKFL